MNVLITYAVDPEFAPWSKLCKFEDIPLGEFTIRRTKIGQTDADFLVTGMGPKFAARAMQSIQHTGYDACVSAGFAGALRPDYEVGDIVVAEHIQESQTKTVASSDEALVEAAASAPSKVVMLLSSATIVASASEKMSLALAADAVDMESFTVVSAAQSRGIPSIAIRVISDRHDQEMPVDFSASLDDKGQVSTASVLRLLAGNPAKLGALMRLGRESKAAAEKLALFLRGYLGNNLSGELVVPASASGNVSSGMGGRVARA